MYIIDGHNLIGSGRVPGIHLAQEDDEWRLVQWLRARQPRLRQPLVVVFDSGVPGGQSQALSGGGVTVIFAAQRRHHADQVIFARVREALVRSDITVVTNDAVLREAVTALGAQTLTVDAFLARLQKASKRKPKGRMQRPQPEPKLPKSEVEEWLALFEQRQEGNA